MRIITAITPDYIEVLKHTLPRNIEQHPVTVLRSTEAYSPEQTHAERIKGRCPCKPAVIAEALFDGDGARHAVWLDADAWIVRPIDWELLDNCDVAVTVRPQSERGTKWPFIYDYTNAGVVFFTITQNPVAVSMFLERWKKETEETESRSDQEGLNRLLLKYSDLSPQTYGKVIDTVWNCRVKILSTDEYNWSGFPSEPPPNTKILHMKNNQRREYDLAEWTKRRFDSPH